LLAGWVACSFLAGPVLANGLTENVPWQFQTTQDKVNKGVIVDLMEKKKGGFYDSYTTTNNISNTTYIDKQFNCSQTSGATGNADTLSNQTSTSSPTVTPSSALNASTTGNTASNGLTQMGSLGVLTAGLNGVPGGSATTNDQATSGTLSSGVTGSNSSSTTGTINSGGGQTNTALNSNLTNTGYQTSSISGSTACSGLRTN
jgi:hypothetical protein